MSLPFIVKQVYILAFKMSKKEKQIRISGWFILGIYLFLLGLNTIHYHHYDFNTGNLLQEFPSNTHQVNDIIQDFTGSCFIHHFTNTVLNYAHSSSEIIKTKPLLTDYFHPHNIYIYSSLQYSSVGLRAPPASV